MKAYNFCNNCGRTGHLFHQCKNPITSTGIIVFRISPDSILEYLLICRKDTLGYVDFLRGKYPLYNKRYILNIIGEMTLEERNKLINNSFDKLWSDLWGEHVGIQYRGEEKISREKFDILKSGVTLLNDKYSLQTLIDESVSVQWMQPEWGFPKGRRNYHEKDLTCALREFEEETGYSKNNLKIIQNILPLEEICTGSNYKSYKHKYYLAYMDNDVTASDNFQKTEVSNLIWASFDKTKNLIRNYNYERLEIIDKVDYLLNNYTIN